jgi:spore maturation protein CgeB
VFLYGHLRLIIYPWILHINVAGKFADNMRLFEATGMGTLLITDWKENLHKMFELGKEVIAYRTAEECVDLIQYYLEHDKEREAIACEGQERTLREHTCYQRMKELVELVGKYL